MRFTGLLIIAAALARAAGLPAQDPGSSDDVSQAAPPPVILTMTPSPEAIVASSAADAPCCCPACCSRPCSNLRIDFQYLIWWVKDTPLPVPLATGDINDDITNPTSAGLADPTTIVLLGNTDIGFGAFSGFRGNLGLALDESWSAEIGGFVLEQKSASNFLTSANLGRQIIFRPFITIVNVPVPGPLPDVLPPGSSANAGKFVSSSFEDVGSLTVDHYLNLWGGEANLLYQLRREGDWRIDLLAGFRTSHLREDLRLLDLSILVPGGVGFFLGEVFTDPGDQFNIFERFGTENHFYGGQVGVCGEYRRGRYGFRASGKLALGGTCQTIIQEATSEHIFVDGTEVEAPGGLLVTPFNIGRHTHSVFSIVNEIDLTVSYYLGGLRLFLGYDFLYWSQVVRPGNQIDLVINDSTSPISPRYAQPFRGVVKPNVNFIQSDFWAQGLHLGFELSF